MSSTVHLIVGSITVLLFLVNVIMYVMEMARGIPTPYHRLISIAAATGLLLQYALGFMLLGAGKTITWTHVIIALVAVIPVGAEHMSTANEPQLRRRAMIGLTASVLTLLLVLGAYAIGEMSAS